VTGRGTWLTDPQALSEQIASINSRLRELWDEHIRENDGVPLPHLYLGEIASWFVEPAERGAPLDDDRRALCTLLDKALHEGDGDVRELIQVSFIENLPLNASQWFLPCFGSALTETSRATRDPRAESRNTRAPPGARRQRGIMK
jgi:hypothetical protein